MTLFPHFLGPPSPHVTFLSTFTSEITNKNCYVTFLLTPTPHPPKFHILFEWPLKLNIIFRFFLGGGPGGGGGFEYIPYPTKHPTKQILLIATTPQLTFLLESFW